MSTGYFAFDVEVNTFARSVAEQITSGDPPPLTEFGHPVLALYGLHREQTIAQWNETLCRVHVAPGLPVGKPFVSLETATPALSVGIDVLHRDTLEPVQVIVSTPIPSGFSETERLHTIYALMRWALLHELRECFRVDGERILEPILVRDHGGR